MKAATTRRLTTTSIESGSTVLSVFVFYFLQGDVGRDVWVTATNQQQQQQQQQQRQPEKVHSKAIAKLSLITHNVSPVVSGHEINQQTI